jgi:transcriptional regulator with XRE-family HTH domain
MPDKDRKKALEDHNPMTAEAFRAWRKRLGLKQKDAADLLGLKKRMIQYYETGSRSGKHVSIPKSIRLACYALEAGVGDYDGKTIIDIAPVEQVLRPQLVPPTLQDELADTLATAANDPGPEGGEPEAKNG